MLADTDTRNSVKCIMVDDLEQDGDGKVNLLFINPNIRSPLVHHIELEAFLSQISYSSIPTFIGIHGNWFNKFNES